MVEERTHDRACLVWPRRAGKDLTALNIMAMYLLTIRPGNYYYFLPTYTQGEKVIWDGKFADHQMLDVFPGYWEYCHNQPQDYIESIDNRKMKVKFKNGSLFQVVGASEEDLVVGTNPVGCVFSEYSLQSPKFWEYIRPILRENGGFAIFTYTMRGLNHGWRLYETNKDNPRWHVEFHTCETVMHNGKRIITQADIDEELRSGMPEELVRQEFYNDPYASNLGAYYANQMRRLMDQERIGSVPWNPEYPVHTAWDLGSKDATAIWFFQVDWAGNINVIDTYSSTGEGLEHYIKFLKTKPYTYGQHFAPHDIGSTDFSTGKTRLEYALGHGFRFVRLPKLGVQEGIEAARAVLPRCRFDAKNCFNGLEALRQYCKEENGLVDMEGRPMFREKPKHDWTSHYADAFRYLALAVDTIAWNNGRGDNGEIFHLADEANHDWDVLNF